MSKALERLFSKKWVAYICIIIAGVLTGYSMYINEQTYYFQIFFPALLLVGIASWHHEPKIFMCIIGFLSVLILYFVLPLFTGAPLAEEQNMILFIFIVVQWFCASVTSYSLAPHDDYR